MNEDKHYDEWTLWERFKWQLYLLFGWFYEVEDDEAR